MHLHPNVYAEEKSRNTLVLTLGSGRDTDETAYERAREDVQLSYVSISYPGERMELEARRTGVVPYVVKSQSWVLGPDVLESRPRKIQQTIRTI